MVRRPVRAPFGLAALVLLAACGSATVPASTAVSPIETAVPSGPTASLSPRSGPPGTEVTVTGSGWPAQAVIQLLAGTAQDEPPYATVTAAEDGSFTTRFRIEKQPNGATLRVGGFNLIARSDETTVDLVFRVETRRPLGNPAPGG